MRLASILLFLSVGACEKNLALPDAPMLDASPYCTAPAPPLGPGTYVLYLNAEGVALIPGSDNSSMNMTTLVKAGGATVPAFLPGDPNRLTFIADVVRIAQAALAPYSIDIVTTRPASGVYYMFVLGGDAPSIIDGGVAGQISVSLAGCQPRVRTSVDLMFDVGTSVGTTFYASTLLSDLGSIAGLGLTTDPGDCECRLGSNCVTPELCTFGAAATTSTDSHFNCGRTPTQDEPALLKTAFGCR
jgi:hypothetical protein